MKYKMGSHRFDRCLTIVYTVPIIITLGVDYMRLTELYMPTLREAPADAEIASDIMSLRAGMMRKITGGLFSYLPLGLIALNNIADGVRKELNQRGAVEMLNPSMMPLENLGYTDSVGGDNRKIWKLRDFQGKEYALIRGYDNGLSHIIKDEVKSYKQLPLRLYSTQFQYTNEERPRFGVVRGRNSMVASVAGFDKDVDSMDSFYSEMWATFESIFNNYSLDSKSVNAGGEQLLFAVCENGADSFVQCSKCEYAALEDFVKVVYKCEENDSEPKPMERVHTPDTYTIEQLTGFLGVKHSQCAKALILNVKGELVVALIPGDRDVSEAKLANYLGVYEEDLEVAEDEFIHSTGSGVAPGFTGPVGLLKPVRFLIDKRVTEITNMVVGANEADYHLINVNYGRDFKGELVEDLIEYEDGDICPNCGGILNRGKGITVVKAIKVGDSMSKSMGATYLDENGKDKPMNISYYNIDVSKLMAAIIESHHDESGIIWPLNSAPFHCAITVVNNKDQVQMDLGESIYSSLINSNIKVLLDNRADRAGVKFNDRDLIGIPIRITVGKKAPEGVVEYSIRGVDGRDDISVEEILPRIAGLFNEMGLKSEDDNKVGGAL
ncbi:MAG: proline--tRNA ligase [Tissierellia bacterium]|nr:proline--tRNA ligase [Tissierellia bacterium]